MITASIVTYHHTAAEIKIVLDCVINSSVEKIYLIDNTNNDLLRELDSLSPKIRYIHNENIGYGGSHNIAIREAMSLGSKYHVVVNPDIYFEKGTIEALAEYLDQNSDVGQVMPKVFYPNGDLQYLCKLLPSPSDFLFRRFLPSNLTQRQIDKFQLKHSGYDKIMNVPFLSGCFMFFRISALKKVGLFDDRYFMYAEDLDLTRRIHQHYKTIFLPYVSIVHAHADAPTTSYKMLRVLIVNIARYFNKWGWFFDKERRGINNALLKELEL